MPNYLQYFFEFSLLIIPIFLISCPIQLTTLHILKVIFKFRLKGLGLSQFFVGNFLLAHSPYLIFRKYLVTANLFLSNFNLNSLWSQPYLK